MEKILNKIKKIIPVSLFEFFQPFYHIVLAWLAACIYRFPANDLIVIGITGTTGKTTSVYMLAKVLSAAGYKTGFTSTAIFNDGEREWLNDKKMTMVGRFYTQKILRKMVKNNCCFAVVETTSQGIVQFRHKFINYDILVFTGLYPEHIEAHGSFEKYKEAKGRLFAHLGGCKHKYTNERKKVIRTNSGIKKLDLEKIPKAIVANGDDEFVEYFLSFPADQKVVYTTNRDRLKLDIQEIKILEYQLLPPSDRGTDFIVNKQKISLKLLGDFNATNAMNAFAVANLFGLKTKEIKQGLEEIKGIAGRMEMIDMGQDFIVLVDYAFEPQALLKLYKTVNLIPHNKIIHVLGSTGGGRDVARRPKLGQLAGENSDIVIITNEDPYDDDPEVIIRQVAFGAEKAGKKKQKNLFLILEREKAIKKALYLAQTGDIVLLTGKGSEQAICVANGKKIPWDDREVVKKILKNKK